MIFFDQVTKLYSDRSLALDQVTFSVEKGEMLSIVGHSGAGKTTLLKMVLAEEQPTSGGVYWDSTNINSVGHGQIHRLRRKIGSIFQEHRLLPNKNVYENIALTMEASGRSDEDIASDVPHVLELVGLADKMINFPGQLSGGEKQRVAIARAIVNQPDILLADEPTGNLDPVTTFEIIQIFNKINELGTTVLIATHDKSVVDAVGKRTLTLEKGRLVRDDKHGHYVL